MQVDRDGTSAAKRRRERRLRGAWKHEQLSVATALAVATHHSAPRGECRVPHDALRGQKTASAAGKRPAPLAEVAEPHGWAVTVGYVAAPVPLLESSTAEDERINDTALRYLVKQVVERRKVLEEQERKEEKEKEEEEEKEAKIRAHLHAIHSSSLYH